MSYLRDDPTGALLTVHAQPRASRTAVVGVHDGALKIAVQAPPVDDAANEAITEFLAELLGVPRRRVTLLSGNTARRKVFRLQGVSIATARSALGGRSS